MQCKLEFVDARLWNVEILGRFGKQVWAGAASSTESLQM